MGQAWLISGLGLLVTFSALGLIAFVMWLIGRGDVWRREREANRARAQADRRFREDRESAGAGEPVGTKRSSGARAKTGSGATRGARLGAGAGERASGAIPPEIVAMITAAIQAASGHAVRIRTVRYLRDPQEEAVWSRIGRMQVMGSHAVVRRSR